MSAKRMVAALALTASLGLAALPPGAAHAAGSLAEVTVIDRNTGQTLPVYQHQGRYWVQGNPGSRYAVRLYNKSGERLLSVVSVDGVNVISGETAGTAQSGHVFSPWERYDVAGWRKSQAQIAAFFFTSLENSYAARTGRPDDVGVIGVALFRERPPAVSIPQPRPLPYGRRDGFGAGANADARDRAEAPSAAPMQEAEAAKRAAPADSAGALSSRSPPQPQSRLGTGHGQRESSWIEYTTFQRARETPDEVVVINYDSRANLMAMGVIPEPRPLPAPRPRPFPGQPEIGFVPDPPRSW